MPPLRIDIWSDIACPWCYIGKRHIEAALQGFEHEVEVTWRAFELDPSAAPTGDERILDRIQAKMRVSAAQAQAMLDRTTGVAAQDGLTIDFSAVKAANTFDGHRLIQYAKSLGVQDAMKERLMKAYFTDGENLGDRETLIRLAREVGIDARATLEGDAFAKEVRDDEALARELGINGVPFFVMAGKLGVSGAQPVDVLKGALEKALELQ